MKKSLYLLLLALMLVAFSITLVGCDKDDADSSDGNNGTTDTTPQSCDHLPASTYTTDDSSHWLVCTKGCGEKLSVATHTWGDSSVKKESSCTEAGISVSSCTVCNKVKESAIAKKDHAIKSGYENDDTYHWEECETCPNPINKVEHTADTMCYNANQHWKSCKCGFTTEPTNHTWVAIDDNDTTNEKCSAEGCLVTRTVPNNDHQCQYDRGTVIESATCKNPGTIKYSCTVNGCDGFYTGPIGLADHDYTGEYAHNDSHHWQLCKVCGVAPPATKNTKHTYNESTSAEGGDKIYSCVCGAIKPDNSNGYIDPDGWT